MGDGEGGGGRHHRPAALQQQHQGDHEQQMIETAHDMIDTDHEIGARHLQGVGHGSNRRGGAAGQ